MYNVYIFSPYISIAILKIIKYIYIYIYIYIYTTYKDYNLIT